MKDTLIKYVGKYGVGAVIAVYLVHYLTTTVTQKLDENINLQRQSMAIHGEMVDILQDIRDGRTKYAFNPPAPSVSSFNIKATDSKNDLHFIE